MNASDPALPSLQVFSRNAVFLATIGTSFWFLSWGLRRKFDLDIPMTAQGKIIRVAVVFGCWMVASLPLAHSGVFRVLLVVAFLGGLAFLLWPNVVVHLMSGLRHPVAALKSGENEVA